MGGNNSKWLVWTVKGLGTGIRGPVAVVLGIVMDNREKLSRQRLVLFVL